MRSLQRFSLLSAATAVSAFGGDVLWPQFRGPHGNGHAQPPGSPPLGLPTEWSADKNIAWKTPIPGKGWSTPIVTARHIWVTSATPDGHDFFVYGLDRATGAIFFEKKLFHSDAPEPLGNDVNGYASPSGLADGPHVFVHFGSYGTACLDEATGAEVWRRTDLPCRHYRGPGSSLAQFGENLILSMDGVDVQYLTALDKKTGKTVWKTDRTVDFGDLGPDGKPKMEGDLRKAYTTPIFLDPGTSHPWFISSGAKATYGYDAATGKELWRVLYPGFSNASSPVYADGLAIINTGYGKANLLAMKVDGATRGDVPKSAMAWDCLKRVPQRSSPIVVGDLLFMVDDGGFASCLDMKTGEVKWSERLEGNFSGSPIFADGHVIACSEKGACYLIAPVAEKLTIVQQNNLPDGMLASPAVAGNALILRTKSHVYCVRR